MNKMPSRDITGKCVGECRDRVYEGELERQQAINDKHMEYSAPSSDKLSWALDRDAPPGVFGGRM